MSARLRASPSCCRPADSSKMSEQNTFSPFWTCVPPMGEVLQAQCHTLCWTLPQARILLLRFPGSWGCQPNKGQGLEPYMDPEQYNLKAYTLLHKNSSDDAPACHCARSEHAITPCTQKQVNLTYTHRIKTSAQPSQDTLPQGPQASRTRSLHESNNAAAASCHGAIANWRRLNRA